DLGVRKGTAWVLVMGVNRSSRPVWNLRFAANDAHSMGQTIRARLDPTLPGNSRSPFGQLVLRPLISDDATPEGATKERLHETLAEVRGKAQPEDMVLLFFSGHGYT